MMDNVFIPAAILGLPRLSYRDIHFISYTQANNYPKNRVVFECNAISLVLQGVKEVYRFSEKTVIHKEEGTLIPEGNSLIAERTFGSNPYSSLVVLFSTERVREILEKFQIKQQASPKHADPSIKFQQNIYLKEYVKNMCSLISNGAAVPPLLIQHRLEELIVVLIEQYPKVFYSVFNQPAFYQNMSLKILIENHLMDHLSLEEFAFLAHKSLSSFKRDFEKAYGISPGRYIRERKLEIASKELLYGKNPSEIYFEYGYETPSNFIQAFKKKYGLTPKEFQMESTSR